MHGAATSMMAIVASLPAIVSPFIHRLHGWQP
jgi:hypothetical protein